MELGNETKIKNSTEYKKAISTFTIRDVNHKALVRYNPEIPYMFEPSFFNGLPGLISEIYVNSYESHLHFSYILKSIELVDSSVKITPPIDELKLLSEKESEALFKKSNGMYSN